MINTLELYVVSNKTLLILFRKFNLIFQTNKCRRNFGAGMVMSKYLIVKCPYCNEVRAVKGQVKTYTCFRCGKKVKLLKSQILARTNNHNEVPILTKKFKMKFLATNNQKIK